MDTPLYSVFDGTRRLATGTLAEILPQLDPEAVASGRPLLFFDHATGVQRDFDLRGTPEQILARAEPPAPKAGPGRPKLGVISTEVTLLPRHWDWLAAQPARASGTLRRLVEEAMARDAADPRRRLEALGKVLWAVAGNEPGFEEAARALFAGDAEKVRAVARRWSGDLPAFVEAWT